MAFENTPTSRQSASRRGELHTSPLPGAPTGAMASAPIGLPGSGPAWSSPTLLAACLLVGVFSNAIGYGIDQFGFVHVISFGFGLFQRAR